MNIEFEKQMGRNIRHIREEKGMTQELLSAKLQLAGCDITRSAVAKIEVEAGHGGTSGRYKQWEEVSYENAWCLSVMGITS